MKVKESLNVTFDESPPPTKLSSLVDDDVGEEEAIRKNTKVVNNNNEEDESIEVDKIVNIKESKNHPLDQVIGNLNQRTLRSQAQNHSNFFCFIVSRNKALKDESWVVAMQEELNQFIANDVWELVALLINSKSTKTPMTTEIKLTKDDEADFMDSSKYRGTGIETIVYADSDHAGDYVDRKSTSGVYTFMGCFLTSWFAKKQTALAISTSEAEYVFAGKACQQALWMKQALIDYDIRLDDVPIIVHPSRQIDEELRESYRTLEKCLFREGRIVTPSFIAENNMLPFFQAVGLEPFLTLNEPICPRFVVEFYHSLKVKRDEEERPYIEFKLGQLTFKLTSSQLSRILQTPYALETFYTTKWSLNSLDDHPNSSFFGPKHDLVKKNITTPRTTQNQLLRDSNKLYLDQILQLHFDAYLSHLMPFAMLLTLLFNHILQTNPQAIVPSARLTFHEHVMDPLDISRNPSKEKGKKIASLLVTSSSSSSSDDNEAPSFLEFYDELSDNDDLTKAQ
ncbi:hypothetical protein Tco_0316819 [Tanacetum coccineum]